MILPCLSITRYTGIPEMTLGWMNSSWSTNSAEAPGNCGFSSDESKGCCCRTAWDIEYKHYLLITSLWLWQWKALYKRQHKEGFIFLWTMTSKEKTLQLLSKDWMENLLHNAILQKLILLEYGHISCLKKLAARFEIANQKYCDLYLNMFKHLTGWWDDVIIPNNYSIL